eukprot:6209360-Pleurochrysis_carterae.AAC.1
MLSNFVELKGEQIPAGFHLHKSGRRQLVVSTRQPNHASTTTACFVSDSSHKCRTRTLRAACETAGDLVADAGLPPCSPQRLPVTAALLMPRFALRYMPSCCRSVLSAGGKQGTGSNANRLRK